MGTKCQTGVRGGSSKMPLSEEVLVVWKDRVQMLLLITNPFLETLF